MAGHKSKRNAATSSRQPTFSSSLPWLYGTHPVLAALENPARTLHRLLCTQDCFRTLEKVLEQFSRKRSLPSPEIVKKDIFDSVLPPGAVHQGIALSVSPLPALGVEDLIKKAAPHEHAHVIVLDQVTDPHNVGAIIRSAAAFNALAVIVPDRSSPDETGTLAKAASGALERIPLIRVTNLARTLALLKEGGFWCAGLDGTATETLAQAKLSGKIALVMGSEGDGLRRLTREHCDYLLRLPISNTVESLNVSNAAAIALYEMVRE